MKKIALFLICLFGLASAQVQIPYVFRWHKSTESAWHKKKLVFIQGANITLTVTGDTSLTIAGTGGGGADTLGLWRVNSGAYPGSATRLHLQQGTGITVTSTGDTTATFAATLGTDIAFSELQTAAQDSMHSWVKELRNSLSGGDTLRFKGDTLALGTNDTVAQIIPSVGSERLWLGRPGKWTGDSGQTEKYQDFANSGGFGNPVSGYLRIYAKGDSVWAKTSAGDSISLSRYGGGGGGADTLTIFNVDGGAFNTGERIQFLSGAGITITKANAESLTFAITDNGVTGAKIALTSQATGDIMYYDGTDWVVQGTHLANTLLHGNGAAAPTFSAVVGGDIGANEVDGTKIAITNQASGDIMYYDGTDWVRLAVGGANTVLHGTIPPAYSAIVSGDVTAQTLDSTDLGNNSVSSNEIADRTKTIWIYPPYSSADMLTTNDLTAADSGKYLGCAFMPNTYGDSASLVWQSVDSTGKIINAILAITLDNFASWADTAVKLLYATQSTTIDSVKMFLYRNSYNAATNFLWQTATDSTASLKSVSSGAWTVWGGNWVIGAGTTPTGSWADGDVMFIRLKYVLNGTAGTAYAKTGKIRIKYNVKS